MGFLCTIPLLTSPQGFVLELLCSMHSQTSVEYCHIDEITTKDMYTYIINKWKITPAAGKIKWIELRRRNLAIHL